MQMMKKILEWVWNLVWIYSKVDINFFIVHPNIYFDKHMNF